MNDKTSLYERVTARITAELEAGRAPWVKPWVVQLPYNAVSQRPYRGTNVLLLWDEAAEKGYRASAWLTYKQAQELGGYVKKGARSTEIVYTSSFEKTLETEAEEKTERISFLKSYRVFNVEQTEGLPAHLYKVSEPKPFADRQGEVEQFLQELGIAVQHGGTRAFYSPSRDLIQLPSEASFKDAHSYYATYLHECGHWTGHPSRLSRDFSGRFGTQAYAFEELVAELTCAFVAARLGIQAKLQHAEYIGSWLRVLQQDQQAIFTAAARAAEAADFLFEQQAAKAAEFFGKEEAG